MFADFAQVHYIVENTMAFLRSGLACCILVMGTTLLATVEMTRADDPSAPWTTRALRQTASDYWTAPPSAVRVCVLDSSPVVSAKVPDSIPPGTVLSPAKAKEVGPRHPADRLFLESAVYELSFILHTSVWSALSALPCLR